MSKQSEIKTEFHRDFPAMALLQVAEVLKEGNRVYGQSNWRTIDCDDHINHAINHLLQYMSKDNTEDHLSHAAARIMFALQLIHDMS